MTTSVYKARQILQDKKHRADLKLHLKYLSPPTRFRKGKKSKKYLCPVAHRKMNVERKSKKSKRPKISNQQKIHRISNQNQEIERFINTQSRSRDRLTES